MKVGDKIYCYNNNVPNEPYSFRIGCSYRILDIVEQYSNTYFYIENEYARKKWYSSTIFSDRESDQKNINNHFYTLKELRKDKLKKLK